MWSNNYSRESVGQLADFSISGNRGARFLNELAQCRSLSKTLVCDNGTEFTFKAMFFWSKVKWYQAALHSTWQANSECLRRKLQQQVHRQLLKPALVQITARSQE
jgi:IS30 family transposase